MMEEKVMTQNPLKKRRKMNRHVNWTLTAVMAVLAIFFIMIPLYITVVTALKSPSDMNNLLALPHKMRWANFSDAWQMTDFPIKFRNTAFITFVTILFTLPLHSAIAYAIVRNREHSKFFTGIYYYFLSAMFIPFNVVMLPLVSQVSRWHMDNVFGITVLYIVFGIPMNIFLYAGFIKKIPLALEESAVMDGATPFQVFYKVIFPMLMPMHATVAILSFIWTWNDFLMPLVLLSDPNQQTLQLSQYVFQGQFSTQYNLAFASYMLVLIPVLIIYVIFQKWIIAGVTDGAVK